MCGAIADDNTVAHDLPCFESHVGNDEPFAAVLRNAIIKVLAKSALSPAQKA